jgi:hypothetical protein
MLHWDRLIVIGLSTIFWLLTDFVCLYNYEFWLSLCKIVRSSVILLLPLFGRNVVFLEVILKLCDVYFMHHFDLHIIIRWPDNVKRVHKICIHCGHFIHCYILLNYVLYVSRSWQSVTISDTHTHYRTWKLF